MVNWIIGIIIFSFAGWMLYKNIHKAKQGSCPSCSTGSDCTCGKTNNKCH